MNELNDPAVEDAPVDHGVDVAALRQRLAESEERNLNLIDAVIGAEAAAAQAHRDIDEIFYRLDVRESELAELKQLLGFELETPLPDIARWLAAGSTAAPTERMSDDEGVTSTDGPSSRFVDEEGDRRQQLIEQLIRSSTMAQDPAEWRRPPEGSGVVRHRSRSTPEQ